MMRWTVLKCVSVLLLLGLTVPAVARDCPDFLDHEQRKLHSRDSVNLCEMAAGKPMLVVNTASRCGYTGQFEGLEALHQRYKDRGLTVVGFASDDFRQEADSEEEAAKVCFVNFGVSFTMIAPSAVTGEQANPVFQEINRQSQPPSWNFTKYVIDREGRVAARFPSQVRPEDARLIQALESVL